MLAGFDAARAAGFESLKMNAVVIRGFNDDELADLVEFASGKDAELRFIEYMDVGGATDWSLDKVVSRDEILEILGATFGSVEPLHGGIDASAPAQRYRLPDGRIFGIVASTTTPFCRTCDRSRLTADGMFYTCLYGDSGVDLREPLRSGVSDAGLADIFTEIWENRDDRGAEERAGLRSRGVLHDVEVLRSDPHREMHTRGG